VLRTCGLQYGYDNLPALNAQTSGVLSDPVDAEFIDLMKKNRAFYSATHAVFEGCGDLAGWSRKLQEFDDRGRIPSAAS
jgi:hypothetical protein